MKNLKIGQRLALGFMLLMLSTFAFAGFTIWIIGQVDQAHVNTINHPVQRQTYLLRLEPRLTEILWLQSLINAMQAHYDFDFSLAMVSEEFNRHDSHILELMGNIRENIMTDPQLLGDEEAQQHYLGQINELEHMWQTYTTDYFFPLIHSIRPMMEVIIIDPVTGLSLGFGDFDIMPVREHIEMLGIASYEKMAEVAEFFNIVLESTQNRVIDVTENIARDIRFTIFIVLGIVLVGFVIETLSIMKLSRSISKPVQEVSNILGQVAQGHININFDPKKFTKNEVGALNRSAYDLVQVISGMVKDLNETYSEYMLVGNMKHTIDESKYQNSFNEVVTSVNKLLEAVNKDIAELSDVMEKLSNGDFDAEIDATGWEGDWAALPQMARKLSTGLLSVSSEINSMIVAVAAKGDLTFKTDETRYQGGWKKIMAGLNSIAKAVEGPVKVVNICLHEMQVGNFDMASINKKVAEAGLTTDPARFSGVFREMSESINTANRVISSYIDEIGQLLAQMSEGDLRNYIGRDYVGSFDLIKTSMNTINGTLNNTISEISSAADQVLAGANQISSSASDLSSGAQEQAISVQELTDAIKLINMQTQKNTDNALHANDLSGKSSENAAAGNDAMVQMVQAMAQIKESSNGISKIVRTIQDIAFQTNLLALNASVEAARAGEHGKGFSVVAEEVRTLAGRSQAAANETTSLIADSINRVDSGSATAGETANSLEAIVAGVGEVSEIISGISAASKEQAEAIANVSEGIAQISRVTQSNSAVSQQTAAASQQLNAQAETLRQLVSYFKL